LGVNSLEFKFSYHQTSPFSKLKVKIKPEIVKLGQPQVNPQKAVGEYIEAKAWDDFINREDVVVVDTRNAYESDIGSFDQAMIPDIDTFSEFTKWCDNNLTKVKDKKVAMFCTGGIRCEKTTSLLKQKGFDHVYHLKGGILKYFEETGNANGKWHGACFVFDDRLAVDSKLKATEVKCQTCHRVFTTEDIKFKRYQDCASNCDIKVLDQAGLEIK
ncbi:MAG: rhodanese-like domain-containing protein, partial [Pseudomonadota bacterium]